MLNIFLRALKVWEITVSFTSLYNSALIATLRFALHSQYLNKSYGNKKMAYKQLHEPSFQGRYYSTRLLVVLLNRQL